MVDYSRYSLEELRTAWENIDDEACPERAMAIYQRMKLLEQQEAEQSAAIPNWILAFEHWFHYDRRTELTSSRFDARLADQLEDKERRVRRRMSHR